jgi:hypothetical protein
LGFNVAAGGVLPDATTNSLDENRAAAATLQTITKHDCAAAPQIVYDE